LQISAVQNESTAMRAKLRPQWLGLAFETRATGLSLGVTEELVSDHGALYNSTTNGREERSVRNREQDVRSASSTSKMIESAKHRANLHIERAGLAPGRYMLDL